jgi:hypothetical protein
MIAPAVLVGIPTVAPERTSGRMMPLRAPDETPLPAALPGAAPDVSDHDGTQPRLIPPTSRPRPRLPLPAPPASNPTIPLPGAADDAGDADAAELSLAARVDAAIDLEDFGGETPAIAPRKSDLAALLAGARPSDVGETTKRQSLSELERLSRGATRDATIVADPADPRHRQRLAGTHEVDPDDIEAAIELAPPARRTGRVPLALGHAKPRKPGGE